MADKVIIGSKLPFGLVIKHPSDPSKKVTLNGLNSSKIVGATFVTTEVDADFWEAWKAAHDQKAHPFQPITSGAIFETKNQASAGAVAKEYSKRKTGLEPLNPTDHGVKPASKD